MLISSKKKKIYFLCGTTLSPMPSHILSRCWDAGVGHTPKESLLPLAIRELAGSKHVKRPVVRRQTGRQRQRELLLAGIDSITPFSLFRKERGGWEEGSRLSKHHSPPLSFPTLETQRGGGGGAPLNAKSIVEGQSGKLPQVPESITFKSNLP